MATVQPSDVPTTIRRIYDMGFGVVYPLYVDKATRKGRSKREVDLIIRWLTGYDQRALMRRAKSDITLEAFFADAPRLNPDRKLITGVVCGVRVEAIEEPTMQEIRFLDKLIDELAKGKAINTILRSEHEAS